MQYLQILENDLYILEISFMNTIKPFLNTRK